MKIKKIIPLKTIKRYVPPISIILFLLISTQLFQSYQFSQIEDIDFVAGLGCDIDTSMEKKIYSIPVLTYDFSDINQPSSILIETKGSSPVEARVNRQLHTGKKFSLGTEKVYVFSKKFAEEGISFVLDGLMKINQVSNSAVVVTTSNDPRDILTLKIPGYPTAPDYMLGLIKSLQSYSYFLNKQTLSTAYIQNSTEGCKFLAPNLDIVNDKIYFTSLSVFDKGKMVSSIPITLMKYVNILRNHSGSGIAAFSLDDNNLLTFNVTSKRKVKCTKNENNTFNFDIDLDVKGSLSNNNTSTIKIGDFPYRKKELEEKIASYMQSSLIDFINIMKTDYKMDLLNLGYIAASKYGRHKITDWDEEILKSTINVNVNFKISRFGLGRIVFD